MSDLGFTGAGGVGRPFTIQDLFGAVSGGNASAGASSTAVTVLNQYLDEADSVTVTDAYTVSGAAPVTYDTGVWEDGSWT